MIAAVMAITGAKKRLYVTYPRQLSVVKMPSNTVTKA